MTNKKKDGQSNFQEVVMININKSKNLQKYFSIHGICNLIYL